MRPAPFEYFRPHSLEETLELLGRHSDEAKILAGGQSLVPMMNMRLARPGSSYYMVQLTGQRYKCKQPAPL
jgi:CO/xanthine dehydrogenase FAD-binding subunit